MEEAVRCNGCGNVSTFVYKCNKCGETRCFFPLCKGDKGSDVAEGVKTGMVCINCKQGTYEKILSN